MQTNTSSQSYKIIKDLRKLRKAKGLTLRDLSIACGVSYSNLCNLENNKNSPSLNTLANVCEALDAEIVLRQKTKGTQ